MNDVCPFCNKTWTNIHYTCLKQEAKSLALKVRRCELGFNIYSSSIIHEDSILTRLVALISNFGMMTGRLFKAGVYSRPGVYFTGENTIIVNQSTNNKVIFLLLKLNF